MRTLIFLLALITISVCFASGGYRPVETNDLPTLAGNDVFKAAEAKAREVFS